MSKPKISMAIHGQYWIVMTRIMSGEAGVYENAIKYFEIDPAALGILTILEERRKKGEFNNEKK